MGYPRFNLLNPVPASRLYAAAVDCLLIEDIRLIVVEFVLHKPWLSRTHTVEKTDKPHYGLYQKRQQRRL
jgi:hypothetical protein